jgi:serine phosphatase RsbU (regulator of sigma subunit)
MADRAGRDLASAMAEVARALQAEGGAQETLQKMVDLAVQTIVGCHHAGVSLVTPDGIRTPAASDGVPRRVDRLQYDTNQGPCLDAIRERDMYVTDDLRAEDRWPAFASRAAAATGVRSMLSLRLFVEGENLGALNLYSREPAAFGEDSIAVGRLFAAHAAIAQSAAAGHERSELRATRFQDQARIAEELQRSMLTELPDLAPFDVVARYVPATVAAEVGGDWYDALVLPSGDVLLVVGDVVGHDIHAATAMAQVRTTLRALAVDRDEPPGELLTRLDDTLDRLRQFHAGTCSVVRMTRRGGGWTASLAAAGHPPPLLLGAAGADYVDMPRDLLLGFARGTVRHTRELPLRPGSTLLLYTDGLVERRDQSLIEGMAMLREAAADLLDADVGALCDALLARMAPRPTDDVCLLAVRLPA